MILLHSALLVHLALATPLRAETGYDAWLRYDRLDAKTVEERYAAFPAVVVALGDAEAVVSARDELIRGVRGMLGRTLRIEKKLPKESSILLATFDEAKKAVPSLGKFPKLDDDGFWLKSIEVDGQNRLLITAPNERGLLYGVFVVLRKIGLTQPLAALNERHAPAAPVRMIVHWDRLDGSVDHPSGGARPLAGKSIFWDDNHATKDVDRLRDYARLLASLGINSLAVNEPRAGHRLLTDDYRDELAQLSAVLRPWGVRLFVALNSTSPPARDGRGDNATGEQAASWDDHVAKLYSDIPDLGGFVIDADWTAVAGLSEAGVADATHTAAAINAVAAALRPHDGVVICRTCVCGYDRDRGDSPHDPAKVAYEIFQPLDGQLEENVVLQIKHGPMNFQVREPPSPLFGALEKTNQAVEFQLTQEHLGQQRHLCFLVPMWKQTLEFNMHAKKGETPVKELVAGKTFKRPAPPVEWTGGFIAISNARRTPSWLGNDLATANLYGFGRLAWDPNLAGKSIAEEWTRLTFGHDPLVVGTLVEMLLKSWRIYESYTGPLGAGTLTDAAHSHYGPGIESSVSGGWLPWHNADQTGLGQDRTAATGTGFVAQYRPPVAQRFESLETCPEELLLFMHHVPYTHPLKSGTTVIQHIYDSHYNGARDAAQLVQQWEALAGKIDDRRHQAVLKRLQYQAGHAQLWRDAVCNWFMHRSGIADDQGRVGNYPNRFEAEAMQLEGYEPQNVTPWETASGGQAAQCADANGKGAVSIKYDGPAGWFNLSVRYFDENDGAAKFKLLIADQTVDQWTADDTLPDNKPNGHTSTRHESRRVALRKGDAIRIEAATDAGERAAIDYLEIVPAGK